MNAAAPVDVSKPANCPFTQLQCRETARGPSRFQCCKTAKALARQGNAAAQCRKTRRIAHSRSCNVAKQQNTNKIKQAYRAFFSFFFFFIRMRAFAYKCKFMLSANIAHSRNSCNTCNAAKPQQPARARPRSSTMLQGKATKQHNAARPEPP